MRTKGQALGIVLVGLVVAAIPVAAVVGKNAISSSDTQAAADETTPSVTAETSPETSTAPTPDADASTTAAPTPTGTAPSAAVDTTKAVHPALVYADWDAAARQVEASGFVGDLVEAGGVCTLTLTNGSAQVQATVTSQLDASTTNCGPIVVPGAQLAAGVWQAVLTYRSETSHGTAEALTVSVPAS
jgi:hypothetical protein